MNINFKLFKILIIIIKIRKTNTKTKNKLMSNILFININLIKKLIKKGKFIKKIFISKNKKLL